MNRHAYLVVGLRLVPPGKLVVAGDALSICSEATPSVAGNTATAVLYASPACVDYEAARRDVLAHVRQVWPWLLPKIERSEPRQPRPL